MERNMGKMWVNGRTVIAGSTLVYVTNSTDPILESLDTKVKMTKKILNKN